MKGLESELESLRARYESLTSREREVLQLVSSGLLNKQVATELGLSEITVKLHRGSAMRKMRAQTLAQVVRMMEAIERGTLQGHTPSIGGAATRSIVVPLISAKLKSAFTCFPERNPLGANIAIAIVDDDELVRIPLAGLLRSFGIRTAAFESAEALLDAGANRFDCIVSDLQMPGTSGLELRRVLNGQADGVPVIIMTAFPERANDARRLGEHFPLIEKPIDSGQLIACIENVLGCRVG